MEVISYIFGKNVFLSTNTLVEKVLLSVLKRSVSLLTDEILAKLLWVAHSRTQCLRCFLRGLCAKELGVKKAFAPSQAT